MEDPKAIQKVAGSIRRLSSRIVVFFLFFSSLCSIVSRGSIARWNGPIVVGCPTCPSAGSGCGTKPQSPQGAKALKSWRADFFHFPSKQSCATSSAYRWAARDFLCIISYSLIGSLVFCSKSFAFSSVRYLRSGCLRSQRARCYRD